MFERVTNKSVVLCFECHTVTSLCDLALNVLRGGATLVDPSHMFFVRAHIAIHFGAVFVLTNQIGLM